MTHLYSKACGCTSCLKVSRVRLELKRDGAGVFVRSREATFEPGELINDLSLSCK